MKSKDLWIMKRKKNYLQEIKEDKKEKEEIIWKNKKLKEENNKLKEEIKRLRRIRRENKRKLKKKILKYILNLEDKINKRKEIYQKIKISY